MPKSKKRIKKPLKEKNYSRGAASPDDGEAVGLISSMRGGFQEIAGVKKPKGADKKGIGVAGILVIVLLCLALIAFFTKGVF